MKFSDFFIKQMLIPFFVISTCVSIGAGILGIIYQTERSLTYYVLFVPAIYGIATALPSIVMYSKKELSIKSLIIRRIINFLIVVTLVLGINYFGKNLTSISVTISLVIVVFIIFLTVNVVEYVNELRISRELNNALQNIRKNNK